MSRGGQGAGEGQGGEDTPIQFHGTARCYENKVPGPGHEPKSRLTSAAQSLMEWVVVVVGGDPEHPLRSRASGRPRA